VSDVPINIIDLSAHFEDEPGAGSPTPAVNMAPLTEAMRTMNIAVASISQNVRAILETLRAIARSGVRGGGGGRGGAGGGGRAGGADDDLRSMQRQRLYMARRGISLAMTGEEQAMMRGEALPPAGQENFYSAFFGVVDRNSAATSRQAAQGMREAVQEQRARERAARLAERERQRQLARDQRRELQAAQRRMSSGQQNRLDEIRRTMGTGGAVAWTDEEQALLSGQASPSGLPGTRSFYRELNRLHTRYTTPPPVPAPAGEAPGAGGGGGGGGIRGMLGAVGAVIAPVRGILALVGTITGLAALAVKLLATMSAIASAQRERLSRVDPVFATMEAGLMVSRLQADIQVARDPNLRASMQQLTNVQSLRAQYGVAPRAFFGRMAAEAATFFETSMLGLEMGLTGLLTGNFATAGQGLAISQASLLGPFFGGMLQNWILGNMTAQARMSSNGMFRDDLNALTVGVAFGRTPYGGTVNPRTAGNWWR
jgi:hypothetical protein